MELRLPDALAERLRARAEVERRSVNAQAIVLLESGLGETLPERDGGEEVVAEEVGASRSASALSHFKPDPKPGVKP